MQLEELRDYKSRLMKELLQNKRIVELIKDDCEVEDAMSLAYTKVFPFEFLPETVGHGDTYVCFDVDINFTYYPKRTYYNPTLRIWVFTHKSKMRLPGGGVRVDELCCEIAKVVNGSKFFGLGEVGINCMERFAPIQDFQGKAMYFICTDFNRKYNPRKPIPQNRKIGE